MNREHFDKERIIRLVLLLFALSSLLFLFIIFIFILTEGLPLFYKVGVRNIVLGMKWAPTKGSFGIFPMIISSFMVTFGALIVGAPLALACATYLSEYAGKKTKLFLKPSLELLAGIPSVVYGFLGVVYIVPIIREHLGGPGFSILSTSLVLGIMILPTITSISFDSLMSVPSAYREGSLAMGATKWQTISRVVLPAARSGILASFILGMGRAVGRNHGSHHGCRECPQDPDKPPRPFENPDEQHRPRACIRHRGSPQGPLLHRRRSPRHHHESQPHCKFLGEDEGGEMRINPRFTDKIVRGALPSRPSSRSASSYSSWSSYSSRAFPMSPRNSYFSYPEDMGRHGGIFPSIVGTVFLGLLSIAFATPLGVGTAIYLTEYTKESTLTRIIRFGVESLAGIPSIIYGLFGFIFFVIKLRMGWSLLSGTLTITIMVLPTIIRTSEEAIKAVPKNLRMVSFSLGATKWETVTQVILPSAAPGILTGIMLSVGRAVSETAAVIFTMGSSLRLPTSIMDSGRTMAVHFYILAREGISMEKAYATALVLVCSILLINIVAYYMMHRMIARYS